MVGSLFSGACAVCQGFDPRNMFPHGHFRQSAIKGYVNYVPSPVRLEFNGIRFWSGEYVLVNIFDLQRHLFRIDLDQICVYKYRIASWGNG